MSNSIEIDFLAIEELIQKAKENSFRAVNVELITLHWEIGKYLSEKLVNSRKGDKIINDLSEYLTHKHASLKGFDKRNLYRMLRFYETYYCLENEKYLKNEIVGLKMTQFHLIDNYKSVILFLSKITWTHHLEILAGCKTLEERIFYIYLTIKERYTVKQLKRQIQTSVFERFMLTDIEIFEGLKSLPQSQNLSGIFKDNYVIEFLNLPTYYNEKDLQKALIQNMKDFILELGNDFVFIGEEYKVQVGIHDYYLDLLFFHRGLSCLVAIELKVVEFEPEHLGKLSFYLEALDRDIKKTHENPSIGILLCPTKDAQVVEYALSRHLSPTLVAEYQRKLIDKKVLQVKLHELFELYENAIQTPPI